MNKGVTQQIAKHLRDVHFGGNWTTVNLRDSVSKLSWQQATARVAAFNTIATLVYHATYYVTAILRVLEGGPLNAKDEWSFKHPPISSQQDWDNMLAAAWENAEKAAQLIEQMPDEKLNAFFTDQKYGTYYRNLQGMIEHMHYHLGQITLIKQLLENK
jgi:uncharacterized damage-inducible protein DinB